MQRYQLSTIMFVGSGRSGSAATLQRLGAVIALDGAAVLIEASCCSRILPLRPPLDNHEAQRLHSQ